MRLNSRPEGWLVVPPRVQVSPMTSHSQHGFTDDDAIALLSLIIALNTKKSRKKRKMWCKEWLQKRNAYSHVNLLNELKVALKDWHNYLRMDQRTYLQLLSLVVTLIERKNSDEKCTLTS